MLTQHLLWAQAKVVGLQCNPHTSNESINFIMYKNKNLLSKTSYG